MTTTGSSIPDVVDQLLLMESLYDDLIETLKQKNPAVARHEHNQPHGGLGWTSSELLVKVPGLRSFFRAHRTFPPSAVIASCPDVRCLTWESTTLHFYCADVMDDVPDCVEEASPRSTMDDGVPPVQEEIVPKRKREHDTLLSAIMIDDDAAIPSAEDRCFVGEHKQIPIEAHSTTNDEVWTTTSQEETVPKREQDTALSPGSNVTEEPIAGDDFCPGLVEHEGHLEIVFAATSTIDDYVVSGDDEEGEETGSETDDSCLLYGNKLTLETFEDQLVKLIQLAPGQRIEASMLRSEYEQHYGTPIHWIDLGYPKLKHLIGALHMVSFCSDFLVLSPSSEPTSDPPPVYQNKEALDELEDEFVDLLCSLPKQRLLLTGTNLENAYLAKFDKPLRLDQTGLWTAYHIINGMTRVEKRKRAGRKGRFMVLAPNYTPPVYQNKLDELEDEFVDLLHSLPDQLLLLTGKNLENAYQAKFDKTLSLDQTGVSKPNQVINAMTRVVNRMRAGHKGRFMMLAPNYLDVPDPPSVYQNQEALDELEDEFVDLLHSLPDQRLLLAGKNLENAYQAKFDKTLRLDQTGLWTANQVINAMTRVEKRKRAGHKGRFMILAPNYLDVPEDDIPKFVSEQLILQGATYDNLCTHLQRNGPMELSIILNYERRFGFFVQEYARKFGVEYISFHAVLSLLPHIQRVRDENRQCKYRYEEYKSSDGRFIF
jgi:hypothetical protein